MTLTKLLGLAGVAAGIVTTQTSTGNHYTDWIVLAAGVLLYVVDHFATTIVRAAGGNPQSKDTVAMERWLSEMLAKMVGSGAQPTTFRPVTSNPVDPTQRKADQ